MTEQQNRATLLRLLYTENVLILPNAWDAGSARIIERAGAKAIATTSGGVSWSLGSNDGQGITRGEQADAVRRIVAAVSVPVTADIEGGYGPRAEDVAETVAAVIDAGAVGINLEDSQADGTLFSQEAQAARIAGARKAASEAGLPDLVINVRTDVILFGIGVPEGRLDDVVARAVAYTSAGADGIFVPGLLDIDVIRELVSRSPLPVNVMAGPGAPSVGELEAAGVKRVSVGTAIAEAAYKLAEEAATEILTEGTFEKLGAGNAYGDLNSAFSKK
jgi:2-methylisocitrate lyase-like PEP mutase family enzyme